MGQTRYMNAQTEIQSRLEAKKAGNSAQDLCVNSEAKVKKGARLLVILALGDGTRGATVRYSTAMTLKGSTGRQEKGRDEGEKECGGETHGVSNMGVVVVAERVRTWGINATRAFIYVIWDGRVGV